MAVARQAREFFRNAAQADFIVKPLLTFYGVASLSRSITLLLRKSGGEETLAAGHGLQTSSWSDVLSGDLPVALSRLGELSVTATSQGLFRDLVKETENAMTMHVRSSAVDWKLQYSLPEAGATVQLSDLLSRLPDIASAHSSGAVADNIANVGEMAFSDAQGFSAKVTCSDQSNLQDAYQSLGYTIERSAGGFSMSCPSSLFQEKTPQFAHAYVNKMFGTIPRLYMTTPFPGANGYSQLCMTYILSYILGMLSRYFPTQWTSMVYGEKGDAFWPSINRAQRLVEQSYPELVAELVTELIKPKPHDSA